MRTFLWMYRLQGPRDKVTFILSQMVSGFLQISRDKASEVQIQGYISGRNWFRIRPLRIYYFLSNFHK